MPAKKLRCGSLIRVSTEKQEKQGESLKVQTRSNRSAIEAIGGRLVETYGGQEHGTAGYERKELDRMLRDAEAGKLDAVVVYSFDRWSRDNSKSEKGLKVLLENDVALYCGTSKQDLHDPSTRLVISMFTLFAEWQAKQTVKKSTESRIQRSQSGTPSSGNMPFGRRFDRGKGKWIVDKEKKRMVQEIAKRYLKGEPLKHLAKEYGVNHSNINKTIRDKCGTVWTETFNVESLNIHAEVEHKVPALLDSKTIAAIRRKQKEARTYHHGHEAKEKYLLAGRVFCSQCGYTLNGQTNHRGKHYYRHKSKGSLKHDCPGPHTYVDADLLEQNVLHSLFNSFAQPKLVEKAISDAIPDAKKAESLQDELARVNKRIQNVEDEQKRLVRAIAKGTISEEEAGELVSENREKKQLLEDRAAILNEQLGHRLTDSQKKAISGRLFNKSLSMQDYRDWKWAKLRETLMVLFDGTAKDGSRLGVYIDWFEDPSEGLSWEYRIQGHLSEEGGLLESLNELTPPMEAEDLDELNDHSAGKTGGKKGVKECASR